MTINCNCRNFRTRFNFVYFVPKVRLSVRNLVASEKHARRVKVYVTLSSATRMYNMQKCVNATVRNLFTYRNFAYENFENRLL